MRRFDRPLTVLLVLGVAALLFSGHSPYRQWNVYRSQRLLILTHRADAGGLAATRALVRGFDKRIAQAQPETSLATSLNQVGSLLISNQLKLAVLSGGDAARMTRGEGEGGHQGPVPLRVLAFLRGGYVLVCNPDLDPNKARLVAGALYAQPPFPLLAENATDLPALMALSARLRIPLHPVVREAILNR